MTVYDLQHVFDLYGIVIRIIAAVFLGFALLLVLCLKLFPQSADRLRKGIVAGLNYARLPKGSAMQSFAFAVASWLDKKNVNRPVHTEPNARPITTPRANNHFAHPKQYLHRDFKLGRRLTTNRAYETYYATQRDFRPGRIAEEPAGFVIKIPVSPTGNRLLVKEMAVLDYLRERAGGTNYDKYLPKELSLTLPTRQQINIFDQSSTQFTARQILARHPDGLDGRHLAWMFNRMLEGLGFIHRQGTVHGSILPQHLMFDAESHGLQIVDWTHARQIGRRPGFIPRRYRQWYPPEAHRKQKAVPASDIFMAARNVIYLAGGDPVADMIPDHVPDSIRRFLTACLLESPNMRPNDAWELHEEFRDLLEDIYGPPEFHYLEV